MPGDLGSTSTARRASSPAGEFYSRPSFPKTTTPLLLKKSTTTMPPSPRHTHQTRSVDDWWRMYRKNAGLEAGHGSECCSARTISFHYCFGPEHRLIDSVLRNKRKFRAMDAGERQGSWPNELGGYSYPTRELAKSEEVWSLLLDKIVVGCG